MVLIGMTFLTLWEPAVRHHDIRNDTTVCVPAQEFIMINSETLQNHHENLRIKSIHPEEHHLGFLVPEA
jgi:hypothetical protein